MAIIYECDRCGAVIRTKDEDGNYRHSPTVSLKGPGGYGSELNMHLCDRCYNGIAAYLENKYAVVSCECDKQTSDESGTYETKVKRWVKKTPGGYVYE